MPFLILPISAGARAGALTGALALLIFYSTSSLAGTEVTIVEPTKTYKHILVLGDSISSGYGLQQGESWVNLLQTRLNEQHFPYKVINASLTGDTTNGGSKRLGRSLKQHNPDIVIIELGGNDGLRGLSLNKMKDNLARMIDLSQKNNHQVLLVGMQLPPNYGHTYTKRFSNIYQTLATEKKTSLVPFIFEGVATRAEFFQADQIHPNADAQIHLLNNIWPTLRPMLFR